ncbi:MAG TPA: hypothetical protein VNF47_20235 [Streptosporangiaceae bacterium]|nr:hypothetical protein [Streptosporangiaceae bacterium]
MICLTALASSASRAARAPLVRGFGGPNLTRYRAYLRALVNLAGSIGAVAAGLAVQLDTRAAYLALVLANALSSAVSAAIIGRLPHLPPVRKPAETGRWIALKDPAYVVVSLLDGLMGIQGAVLVFALPLWIAEHTQAPRWFVGASVLVNTGMVVVLQVRASRGIDDTSAAGRAIRRAGVAFLSGHGPDRRSGGNELVACHGSDAGRDRPAHGG